MELVRDRLRETSAQIQNYNFNNIAEGVGKVSGGSQDSGIVDTVDHIPVSQSHSKPETHSITLLISSERSTFRFGRARNGA